MCWYFNGVISFTSAQFPSFARVLQEPFGTSICLFKKQSHLSARDLRYKDGDPTEKGSVSPTVIVETELNRWINYSLVW